MMPYDKSEIKSNLTTDNIFELLYEWGGEPEYADFGIISATICHNPPGVGSHKLYYYENSGLFKCYTGCEGTFDIFELAIKVMNIQQNKVYDLNEAVRYIAFRFGMSTSFVQTDEADLDDWKRLTAYDKLQGIEIKDYHVQLPEYDASILDNLNYSVAIGPWLREGISQEAMRHDRIGYFATTGQITIPHYDKDGRFVGLRGRTLCKEDAERFGKYRPMRINMKLYSHPLGMNLYNLNNSKDNIKAIGKAIVFEGEKSTLLYQTYFGIENDISVACCGSNLSAYQVQLLQDAGAKEIIVAFDRQFQTIGDDEFKHLTGNLTRLNDKYKNFVSMSFIFDKTMMTGYKDAPVDCGKDIFLTLFKNRIIL